ncbi:glycoside hydrolase family 30 protein [Phanerochaete carnosa HHB-10118-sp]|uniref:Glycoside hydrolase family 30 protein n=1 Tax=Phanerochaete carnosa (strain HHB-10118-sp) TaxID=650164 RepID=K5W192_PHACS|nr:glycoside hydrolase family 30 protein [Phanerochaete carnosa HHB-10118-sp]EKM52669.1 glycoside hydrolase family 30 protein [Phanerochaete carnosa HHB-10118-sp]
MWTEVLLSTVYSYCFQHASQGFSHIDSSRDLSFTVSTTPSQVVNGIGASGAWWPNDVFNFPESVREQVAELLFGPSGAGLSSYRYNVGGGGIGVSNPTRAPETFYVSQGVYNWSADAAGVYFLQKASQYEVPQITAFVNSAPTTMTSNKRSCGGTLVDAQIPAYAQYLADVISHWKEEGVVFTHVSPMNEPDDTFGSCTQEGMEVTPQQRASVVNTLRSTLDAAGLQSVGIMADESSETSNFTPEAPEWIPQVQKGALAAVSHHQYGFGSDAEVAQMGSVGRNLSGVYTWFTEICCFKAADSSQKNNPAAPLEYSSIYEPTMIGALQLGQLVYQSFTQAIDAHFDFWTSLSNSIGCAPLDDPTCPTVPNSGGWNDGLVGVELLYLRIKLMAKLQIYYDPDYATNQNTALYQTKRLFLMKHFANFIWMNSTRFNVSGLPSNVFGMAFKNPAQQSTPLGTAHSSLILMNMENNTVSVQPSQAGLGTSIGSAMTSPSVDWQTFGASSSVSLPGLSITTLLFE